MKKSNAFTLAEVLITLGIIGIVAAMTLPTLIANYQKKVYVNQLKKVVNTTQNACKMALADDEVSDFGNTSLAKALVPPFNPTIIKQYFKAIDITTASSSNSHNHNSYGSSIDTNDFTTLTMPDGSNIYLKTNATAYLPDIGYGNYPGHGYYDDPNSWQYSDATELSVFTDINGSNRAPNTIGIDQYAFTLNSNCNIEPIKEQRECSRDLLTGHGAAAWSCFDYILKNNWEIKYNLPARNNYSHSHNH